MTSRLLLAEIFYVGISSQLKLPTQDDAKIFPYKKPKASTESHCKNQSESALLYAVTMDPKMMPSSPSKVFDQLVDAKTVESPDRQRSISSMELTPPSSASLSPNKSTSIGASSAPQPLPLSIGVVEGLGRRLCHRRLSSPSWPLSS